MTNEQRNTIRNAKHEASRAKSELLRLADKVANCSSREGERLYKIIARLEDWQNSGVGA